MPPMDGRICTAFPSETRLFLQTEHWLYPRQPRFNLPPPPLPLNATHWVYLKFEMIASSQRFARGQNFPNRFAQLYVLYHKWESNFIQNLGPLSWKVTVTVTVNIASAGRLMLIFKHQRYSRSYRGLARSIFQGKLRKYQGRLWKLQDWRIKAWRLKK